MLPAEFIAEALDRATEHADDIDLTSAPVWGVVFFAGDKPVAIDVYAGMSKDIAVACQAMLAFTKSYTSFLTVPFGRLTDSRTKASLIMETAMRMDC